MHILSFHLFKVNHDFPVFSAKMQQVVTIHREVTGLHPFCHDAYPGTDYFSPG